MKEKEKWRIVEKGVYIFHKRGNELSKFLMQRADARGIRREIERG